MKPLFSFIFLLVVISSCQKETSTGNDNAVATEKTLLNVVYGPDTGQTFDAYLPASRDTVSTRVLILVHGGAWTTGDKADFNEYIPVFKKRLPNYALINVNYRLAQLPAKNIFPTQEKDLNAAIAFILAKGGEYRFNANKLAMFGASAGAHLALLQAYKTRKPAVKAVVDMFGPTDMAALYDSLGNPFEKSVLQSLLGGTPASNMASYEEASPIQYVSANAPATLILHGGMDPLVPLSQSMRLKEKLQGANVPVEMVIYPDEGHGWVGVSLADSYERIATFLNTYNP